MSQMLLPLANLASEIMNQWKGRVTYVTVVDSSDHDEEEHKGDDEGSDDDSSQDEEVNVLLDWKDVPFMRELLRVSLFSLCCSSPFHDDISGLTFTLLATHCAYRGSSLSFDASPTWVNHLAFVRSCLIFRVFLVTIKIPSTLQ